MSDDVVDDVAAWFKRRRGETLTYIKTDDVVTCYSPAAVSQLIAALSHCDAKRVG